MPAASLDHPSRCREGVVFRRRKDLGAWTADTAMGGVLLLGCRTHPLVELLEHQGPRLFMFFPR